jgi:hypothetical protein
MGDVMTTTSKMLEKSLEQTKEEKAISIRLKMEKEHGIKPEWLTPKNAPKGLVNPLGPYCLIAICKPNFGVDEQVYKTLGSVEFEIAGQAQKEREQMDGDIGYLIKIGPSAFKDIQEGAVNSPEEWGVKLGDLVQLSDKWSGTNIENDTTRALGIVFREVSDTQIIGKYEE